MKLTVSQLRSIIKEEVSRASHSRHASTLREAAQNMSFDAIAAKVCDLVGQGEPDDYSDVAEVVSDKLAILSTMSRAQKRDGGGLAELDTEETEEQIYDALENCVMGGDSADLSLAARKIVVEFGLDPNYA